MLRRGRLGALSDRARLVRLLLQTRPMGAASETPRTTDVVGFRHITQGIERAQLGTLTVLRGVATGAVHRLDGRSIVIGRESPAQIRIDDRGVSRQHAKICHEDDGYFIEDLGSTNGTFVNGERVTSHAKRLCDGDRVLLGEETVLNFELLDHLEREVSARRFELSVRDGLTGLYNRRVFDDRLRQEMSFANRHHTPICVIVIDLDHFKRVNDRFGHQAGDRVLAVVSGTLVATLRIEDLVARYGGEELAVIARGIDFEGARVVADRVRQRIEELDIVWNGQRVAVTASVGLAHTDAQSYTSPEAIVAAADAALYRAKALGRNRVVTALSPGETEFALVAR